MISQKTGERLIIGIVIAIVLYLLSTGGFGPGGRGVDYEEEQLNSTNSP